LCTHRTLGGRTPWVFSTWPFWSVGWLVGRRDTEHGAAVRDGSAGTFRGAESLILPDADQLVIYVEFMEGFGNIGIKMGIDTDIRKFSFPNGCAGAHQEPQAGTFHLLHPDNGNIHPSRSMSYCHVFLAEIAVFDAFACKGLFLITENLGEADSLCRMLKPAHLNFRTSLLFIKGIFRTSFPFLMGKVRMFVVFQMGLEGGPSVDPSYT
jgi:hypothetical protein